MVNNRKTLRNFVLGGALFLGSLCTGMSGCKMRKNLEPNYIRNPTNQEYIGKMETYKGMSQAGVLGMALGYIGMVKSMLKVGEERKTPKQKVA